MAQELFSLFEQKHEFKALFDPNAGSEAKLRKILYFRQNPIFGHWRHFGLGICFLDFPKESTWFYLDSDHSEIDIVKSESFQPN
jgi:hypothetical protein